MSSSTRKKCLSGQIRNPASGRCVSRRGKIGQRLIGEKDSRRRSDKDRSPKRRKSEKESRDKYSRKTSPERFGDVFRYGMKPFLGPINCEYQAANFGCKGVSSIYTDDGKSIDCAGYCLKNCKPEELLHMFQPPTVARFSEANSKGTGHVRIPWLYWDINFWKGFPIATRPPLLTFSQQAGQKIKFINKGKTRFVTENEASKILCGYIRDMNKRLISFDYMTGYMAGMKRFPETAFIGFDRPWLRPAKDWEVQDGALRMKLQLQ